MTSAVVTSTPVTRRPRGLVVLLLLAVIVALGSWYAGSMMAPTSADADRARASARADVAEAARADRFEAAYLKAYQDAYAAAGVDGTREGRIAGEAAARAATR